MSAPLCLVVVYLNQDNKHWMYSIYYFLSYVSKSDKNNSWIHSYHNCLIFTEQDNFKFWIHAIHYCLNQAGWTKAVHCPIPLYAWLLYNFCSKVAIMSHFLWLISNNYNFYVWKNWNYSLILLAVQNKIVIFQLC